MFPLSQVVWEKKQNGFFTLYKEKHMANTQPQLTKTTAVSTFVIKTRWAFVAIILMRRLGILRNVGKITFWKKKLSFKNKKHTQDFPVKTKKISLAFTYLVCLKLSVPFNGFIIQFLFFTEQLSFFSCSKQKKTTGKWKVTFRRRWRALRAGKVFAQGNCRRECCQIFCMLQTVVKKLI